MSDAPALLIYAMFRVTREDAVSFRAIAERMAAMVQRRDGSVFLHVAEDVNERGTFRSVEAWRDQAALDAHVASAEFKTLVEEIGSLHLLERRADMFRIAGVSELGG